MPDMTNPSATTEEQHTLLGPEALEDVNIGYEMFILALSIFSIINMVFLLVLRPIPQVAQVIIIVDVVISIILMFDFFAKLFKAKDKLVYLKWGWLDFLGSLPFPGLRLFRLFRIVRILRVIRGLGGREAFREIVKKRAESSLYTVIFVAIFVITLSSILILPLELAAPNGNIDTSQDAIWWAFVTVTTVGYGDYFPVSTGGRIVASILMTLGVGIFGIITSYLATVFAPTQRETQEEVEKLYDELQEIKQMLRQMQNNAQQDEPVDA